MNTIKNYTEITLDFWERIKVLFGKKVCLETNIIVDEIEKNVLAVKNTVQKVFVEDIFNKIKKEYIDLITKIRTSEKTACSNIVHTLGIDPIK